MHLYTDLCCFHDTFSRYELTCISVVMHALNEPFVSRQHFVLKLLVSSVILVFVSHADGDDLLADSFNCSH